MAQEYFEHVTKAGERWDLIAHHYYGDATMIHKLLLANPEQTGDPKKPAPLIFKAGIKIRVPVLDERELQQAQLPPWKRDK